MQVNNNKILLLLTIGVLLAIGIVQVSTLEENENVLEFVNKNNNGGNVLGRVGVPNWAPGFPGFGGNGNNGNNENRGRSENTFDENEYEEENEIIPPPTYPTTTTEKEYITINYDEPEPVPTTTTPKPPQRKWYHKVGDFAKNTYNKIANKLSG